MIKERTSAIDQEGKIDPTEDLLERTALCIRSVEHSDLSIASSLTVESLYLLCYPESLEISRQSLVHLDGLTDFFLGEDILGDLILIVRYDPPSSSDDSLGRAVVSLQLESTSAGEGLGEREDII